MGRELKRVALNFDHPLNKTWPGYLNPHERKQVQCPTCGGDGSSPAGKLLQSLWYKHLHYEAHILLHTHHYPDALVDFAWTILRSREGWSHQIDEGDVAALVEADRLWDFTRRPRTPEQAKQATNGGGYWLRESNGYTPTPAEVNAWSHDRLGHDSINAWICFRARAARYDLGTYCADCAGEGVVPNEELQARIDAWEATEPPTGGGWQVWENVSEGSPVSPVFATSAEIVAWLVGQGYSQAAAEGFVRSRSAPSMVMAEGTLYKDIESSALL